MLSLLQQKGSRDKEAKQLGDQNKAKVTPSSLRLNKDLEDIDKDLPVNTKLEWPNKNELYRMRLTVNPTAESIWKGGVYSFMIEVG